MRTSLRLKSKPSRLTISIEAIPLEPTNQDDAAFEQAFARLAADILVGKIQSGELYQDANGIVRKTVVKGDV